MKRLIKQAIQFIGLSGIGWIMDFLVFMMLDVVSTNVFVNNIISSCIGMTFVFCFSTRLVFKSNSHVSLRRKYAIYLVYQLILITCVSKLLSVIDGAIMGQSTLVIIQGFSSIIAKIFITPITMVMNFFVMKNLIEKL